MTIPCHGTTSFNNSGSATIPYFIKSCLFIRACDQESSVSAWCSVVLTVDRSENTVPQWMQLWPSLTILHRWTWPYYSESRLQEPWFHRHTLLHFELWHRLLQTSSQDGKRYVNFLAHPLRIQRPPDPLASPKPTGLDCHIDHILELCLSASWISEALWNEKNIHASYIFDLKNKCTAAGLIYHDAQFASAKEFRDTILGEARPYFSIRGDEDGAKKIRDCWNNLRL